MSDFLNITILQPNSDKYPVMIRKSRIVLVQRKGKLIGIIADGDPDPITIELAEYSAARDLYEQIKTELNT